MQKRGTEDFVNTCKYCHHIQINLDLDNFENIGPADRFLVIWWSSTQGKVHETGAKI